MATILQYPVMQQLLVITTDKTASIRLTNWLQGVLLTSTYVWFSGAVRIKSLTIQFVVHTANTVTIVYNWQ